MMLALNNIVYNLANPAISFLTLAGLVVIWTISRKTPSIKVIKGCILFNIITIVLRSSYCTVANYWMWLHNPAAKNLLAFNYVLKYSFNTYWASALFAMFSGFLFFKLIVFLNRKFNNRFFYDQEPYLVLLGIVINPWPMLLFFVLSSIAILLLIQILNIFIKILNLRNKNTSLERIPMLYIWIPAMVLSLFVYFVIWTNAFMGIKTILVNNFFIKELFKNFFFFR